MQILVINAGSSSIKFALFDMPAEQRLLSGEIERIGETDAEAVLHDDDDPAGDKRIQGDFSSQSAALTALLDYLEKKLESLETLTAIGHRVVHGGENFDAATLIDAEVIGAIRRAVVLAPLHNPANLAGIEAVQQRCPRVPQIAVFDTAFFHTLPPRAFRYAVPGHWYRDHQVRRYGFHGISHQYVAAAAADYLQRPLNRMRLISLHLGNGASAAAIRNGACIDTSMGMTPLEGLVMGTRCGDIDPALPFYLNKQAGIDFSEIEDSLNRDSGLNGLCGERDMRKIHDLAEDGDTQARLAIDIYCYRICKYVGAYHVALGGSDALIFTAGVGEHDVRIRQSVCAQLAVLGIEIDASVNRDVGEDIAEISTPKSAVKVLVIATDEEREIARQTTRLIQ